MYCYQLTPNSTLTSTFNSTKGTVAWLTFIRTIKIVGLVGHVCSLILGPITIMKDTTLSIQINLNIKDQILLEKIENCSFLLILLLRIALLKIFRGGYSKMLLDEVKVIKTVKVLAIDNFIALIDISSAMN